MITKSNDFASINGLYDPLDQPEPEPGLIRRAVRAYVEWRTLRSAVRVLQGMDDRILADIGMSRSEIPSIVYGRGNDRTRHSRTWE
jgi:uncharacterized protein YjiS (DUF1127 family)